jgi:hypothetical protein
MVAKVYANVLGAPKYQSPAIVQLGVITAPIGVRYNRQNMQDPSNKTETIFRILNVRYTAEREKSVIKVGTVPPAAVTKLSNINL